MCGAVDVDISPLTIGSTDIQSAITDRSKLEVSLPCLSCLIVEECLVGGSLKNDTAVVGCGISMTTSRTETKFNVLIGNLNYLRLNKAGVTLNCEVTYNSKSTANTNIVLEISILEGYICTNQRCDQTCSNFDILSIKDLKVCRIVSYTKTSQ